MCDMVVEGLGLGLYQRVIVDLLDSPKIKRQYQNCRGFEVIGSVSDKCIDTDST